MAAYIDNRIMIDFITGRLRGEDCNAGILNIGPEYLSDNFPLDRRTEHLTCRSIISTRLCL
jgi:hypothetical protein